MRDCNTLLDFNLTLNGKKTWKVSYWGQRCWKNCSEYSSPGTWHSKDVGDLNQDFFPLLQSRVSDLSLCSFMICPIHSLFIIKNIISIHDIYQYIYSYNGYPTTLTWLFLEGKDKDTLLFHAAPSKEMKPQPHLVPVILTAFRFGFKVSMSIWRAYWKLLDCLPPPSIKRNMKSFTRARSSTTQIHFLEITGLNLPLETRH